MGSRIDITFEITSTVFLNFPAILFIDALSHIDDSTSFSLSYSLRLHSRLRFQFCNSHRCNFRIHFAFIFEFTSIEHSHSLQRHRQKSQEMKDTTPPTDGYWSLTEAEDSCVRRFSIPYESWCVFFCCSWFASCCFPKIQKIESRTSTHSSSTCGTSIFR